MQRGVQGIPAPGYEFRLRSVALAPIDQPVGAGAVPPVQECPNEEAVMQYNAEEEDFDLLGQLMDENCEQVLDENSDPILTPVK